MNCVLRTAYRPIHICVSGRDVVLLIMYAHESIILGGSPAMAKKASISDESKIFFKVRMTHDEDTFVRLAHMQYDLFCMRNYVARMVLSTGLIVLGALHSDKWYCLLIIAYGAYLMTSKYSSSNHTAHKLIKGIKDANLPFPSSEYLFESDRLRVISLNDGEELAPFYYSAVKKLGEDMNYYYLFRNESGGYMVPKDQLGDDPRPFRDFIERKTGLVFSSRRLSPIAKMRAGIRRRENAPERLGQGGFFSGKYRR